MQLDGQEHTLDRRRAGDDPPGVAHHYANTSDDDVVFRFEIWPAARFDPMVMTFSRSRRRADDAKGAPTPLQIAVLIDEYSDVMEPSGRRAGSSVSRSRARPHRARPRTARELPPPRGGLRRAGSSGRAPPSRSRAA